MPGETKQTTQQTQQSTTAPWQEAMPLIGRTIDKYVDLSPNTGLSQDQQNAINAVTRAAGSVPNFGPQASEAVTSLLPGGANVGMLSDAYNTLKANIGGVAAGNELDPYQTPGFSDAINTMTGDITKAVKGVYAGSGRDPSGAGSFAKSLGRGLTEGIAPVIANQFNVNNANRLASAGNLFNAGNTTAGSTLNSVLGGIGLLPTVTSSFMAPATAQLGAANTAYQQPWENLKQLLTPAAGLASLGSQSSGSGTSVTSQPQDTFSNILGGAAGVTGILGATGAFGSAGWLAPLLMMSDERTKDDIEPIGQLNDGQKVVRFRYKGEPTMRIGLLAQDVAKTVPDAVHDVDGLLMVDHRRATDHAAQMERAA